MVSRPKKAISSINSLRQKHKSSTMSSCTSQEKIDEIFFTFVQADRESQVPLLESYKELEAFLSK